MKTHRGSSRWTSATRWWVLFALLTNLLLVVALPATAQDADPPNPNLGVRPDQGLVEGWEWPLGATVNLSIDDPSTVDNPDHSDTGVVQVADWDPAQTHVQFDLGGFAVGPGYTVTLSDGTTTKSHVVTSLSVTEINLAADSVAGTADPSLRVSLWICDESGCVNRHEDPDSSGGWLAVFAIAGDEGDEGDVYDIVPGTGGDCAQWDDDGDGTFVWWQVPNPHFQVRADDDHIDGWEWPPGASVTVEIDDLDTGAAPDYAAYGTADGGGNFAFDLREAFDIQPGQTVTVFDADSTKVHTVAHIVVTIIHPDTNTLWGEADPGSEVMVWAHHGGDPLHVTADGNGDWFANVTGHFELEPGTGGGAGIYDPDNDSTADHWWVPNPHFEVWLEQNSIGGWEWNAGALATMTIDDPGTSQAVDHTASTTIDPDGSFYFDDLGGIDIQPDFVVNVTDGATTKSHTVVHLAVASVDQGHDTISGTSAPGQFLHVNVWGETHRDTHAASDGSWSVDFSDPSQGDTADIGPGSAGDAEAQDEDGDATRVDWEISNPTFAARPDEDRVEGWGWPVNTEITVEVDDPGTGPGVDHTVVVIADEWGNFSANLWGAYDLLPDQLIAVSGDGTLKEHTVTHLDVTDINSDFDTVSGTADPQSNVDLWWCDEQGCVNRHVAADDIGFWGADFSVPGPGDDEQSILDIVHGTSGDVAQSDEDGDSTQLRWEVADPRLEISYEHDWIQVSGFAPNGQVTYTIFDYEGGHALFGPVTGPVDSHGNGWISSNLHHTDLTPGYYVEAVNESDGEVVSLLIRNVNLDYVGIDDDRAFGTAEPNTTIELNVGETHDDGFSLTADVDDNGYWEANLAAAGHPIGGYRYADVRLCDGEGDCIIAQSPRIHARVGTDSMSVDNFSKNADVTMTLYDSLNGNILHGPVTLRTEGSGSAWVNLWEQGIDLAEGHYITAYDHHLDFGKEFQVERFTFDVMDVGNDTVHGTSYPGEWVDLHAESLFSNWGLDALTGEDGTWTRDYGAEAYDLTEQMWAYGWAIDEQGNWSEDHITGRPNIEASVADDWIGGFNFSPDRPLLIRIYSIEGTELASFEVIAGGDTQFWIDYWTHEVDLQPGMTLDVVDTETGKTASLTLAHLTFDVVDYDNDIAGGQADAGTQVVVRADRLFEHYEITVLADSTGWEADFASLGVDLTPEWGLRALIFDAELDATVADAPRPPEFTAALDQDWVSGDNWTPANTVRIEVFETDGVTPIGDPIYWGTDGQGNWHTDLWDQGLDLQPGQFVVVTDQATGQAKATSLAALAIVAVDYDQDIIDGIAPSNTRITAGCGNDEHHQEFDLFSDGDGNWTADFGAHDFDLTEDMWCEAKIYDDDGDATRASWWVANPYLEARPMEEVVEGRDWPEGAELDLFIDDDDDLANGWLFTARDTVVTPDWDPNTTWVRFEFGDTFNLAAGHFVTLSDGTSTKTHQVTALVVTEVSPETHTVSGRAAPGSEVWTWIHEIQGSDALTLAEDPSGAWSRDFSEYGLAPGTAGPAVQYDDDGDATWIDWWVPNPTFLVRLAENEVHGYEWPIGAEVTLTIDDPATSESDDFTATGIVEEAPWDPSQTFVRFNYEGVLDVGQGFLVTMTDGAVTKEHTVTGLALGPVDADADLVSGTAEAGSEVRVDACDDHWCASRLAITTGAGTWSADFSVPGIEDWEQDILDIRSGTGGEAVQQDEDGDGTQFGWWISDPVLHVVPAHPEVHGHDWDGNAHVYLTIADGDGNQLYFASKDVSDEPWWCGEPCFDLQGVFPIEPGQIVTLSDGQTTRTVHVTELQVTGVDPSSDTVFGSAAPGTEVQVDIHQPDAPSRRVIAGADGTWTADFSAPGNEPWEGVYDLDTGVGGRAIQFEVEGWDDGTLAYWWVPTGNQPPTIEHITAPAAPVALADQPVSVEVVFTDPDAAGAHEVTWHWADGSSETQPDAVSPASASHTYAEAGVYRVEVTVTDEQGASDSSVYEFVVLFDPDGGFVTGGGWIWSERGWCQLDELCANAEGRASFGFVSKYKKGAKVPTGNTQFNFHAGGLNFHSNAYQWLVVNRAGTNAQYKGSGTINGNPAPNGEAYKFLLWAGDEGPDYGDTFRIRIWYEGEGDIEVVVYDNGFDQPIDGGNITIHTKK